ncbi:hypothetical protein IWX90DRAFT_43636 [Phyllosticta citrichinensis]|uniref:Rhodopsin domain-containing protein n=1 Tax=Phyllosticta citrichinensis TaxID=1130410 RepID=A0ABR1Y8A2_9PEZI
MPSFHPLSETTSKAPAELSVCIVFLVLTYIAVGARCWVRIRMIRSFGWDDALMCISLVLFTVYCISIIVIAYDYGGGTHTLVIGQAIHWVLVSETIYVVTAMTVKLSLGVFFLRILIRPWQRCFVYAVMVLITLLSVFFFFNLIFMCGNPKDYLVRYVADKCAPREVQRAMAYLSAAVGAFTDWTYAVLPLQIVLQANMQMRGKISVLLILSLGTIGSICSTVRIKYIEGLISTTDFFWNATMIAIWSLTECGAGITAGSLATLRPLFKHWFSAVRTFTQKSSSGSRNWGSTIMKKFSKGSLNQASGNHRANQPAPTWQLGSQDQSQGSTKTRSRQGSKQDGDSLEMGTIPRKPSTTQMRTPQASSACDTSGLISITESLERDSQWWLAQSRSTEQMRRPRAGSGVHLDLEANHDMGRRSSCTINEEEIRDIIHAVTR